MLDASDPELHVIAQPIYTAAVERAPELDEAVLERGRALTAAGYHEQVKVTEASTLLFAFHDGARVAIRRGNGEFRIAKERISRDTLLDRVANPEQFSANVLLRPVVQDYLLPTIAYTGGPAECAYFAQAGVVYEKLLGRVTPVVPRFSATLVEPRIASLLEKYALKLPEVFQGPEHVGELLAGRILPSELRSAFETAKQQLEKSIEKIESSLNKLDPTLVDSARRAASKMFHQLTTLREKAARAEAMRSDVLRRHASQLSNALYPNKNLQEREIAGISFVARHGLGLIESLYQLASAGCPDHQIVYI
jgi:bacillithiol biosynthesis cysteine-adding enzyme BshC